MDHLEDSTLLSRLKTHQARQLLDQSGTKEPDDQGSCWTCISRGKACDTGLPICRVCRDDRVRCFGYAVRLRVPEYMNSESESSEVPRLAKLLRGYMVAPVSPSLSPFGLEDSKNSALHHWINHISSIALAVDSVNNGYRALVPMALETPALLNAMLAVSACHASKWRKTKDTQSRRFLHQALAHLHQSMEDPNVARNESTLAVMLLLLAYEVFNGSPAWKGHYIGIASWIRAHSQHTYIHPFLKNLICMLETQSIMNTGLCRITEVETWLNDLGRSNAPQTAIDPLFGSSTQLPKLMLEAGRFYGSARKSRRETGQLEEHLVVWAESLLNRIKMTAFRGEPVLSLACDSSNTVDQPTETPDHAEHFQAVTATADIFRYALEIFVTRIIIGTEVPPSDAIHRMVDSALRLLPRIPPVQGPGSNLGWPLVVIGTEVQDPNMRQYIRSRWRGIHMLEMNNSRSGQQVVEAIWRQVDLLDEGYDDWQDINATKNADMILL